MKKILYIPIVITILFLAMPGAALSAEQAQDIVLRVSILDNRDKVNLALKGKYKIYPMNSDVVVMEGPYLAANVTAAKDGIRIGSSQTTLSAVKVKVARDSNIYVDSRRFRGEIDIIRKDNGKLMIVNYIGLEDYLYGVLYHEVSHRWPAEVLKAQAIAARTFALYQARQNKLQPYDLRSDIYSQVYGGRTSEKWSTTRAVDMTKGEVLTYNGDIIPCYYHATCAGYTEDASNLWNISVPYLKEVKCDYCKDSKHYRWRKEIPLWELADKLKGGGYKIGKITSVDILSKDKSDRVDKMEIKDDAGIAVILTGKDFRQLIGPNEVRSTKFDASAKLNSLLLEGMGWGHGVGMCQWGAYGQARKGRKAEEILKYYYPGTEISTIDKIKM